MSEGISPSGAVDLNGLQERLELMDSTAYEVSLRAAQLLEFATTAPDAAMARVSQCLGDVFGTLKEPLEGANRVLGGLAEEMGVPLGEPEDEAEPRLTLEEMAENIEYWERDLENYSNCLPARAYEIMKNDSATPDDLLLLHKLHAAMSEAVNALARDPDVFDVWAWDQLGQQRLRSQQAEAGQKPPQTEADADAQADADAAARASVLARQVAAAGQERALTMEEVAEDPDRDVEDVRLTASLLADHAENLFEAAETLLAHAETLPEADCRELRLFVGLAAPQRLVGEQWEGSVWPPGAVGASKLLSPLTFCCDVAWSPQ